MSSCTKIIIITNHHKSNGYGQSKLEVKLQFSKPLVSEIEKQTSIGETFLKRAEYFTFLNDRGLL